MIRVLARLGAVLTIGLGLLLSSGWAASAHVTVHSSDAIQGGHAEIAFRVPTESDTASTVKLSVALPTDTPIAAVSVQPHPGWTYKVTNTALPTPIPDGHGGNISQVVSTIEWTAISPDSAIKPGEYDTFRIAAGPLPKADRVVFKVLQTYSDNSVARWIDLPAAAGAAEPEHPAAVLSLPASAGQNVAEVSHTGHSVPAATSSTGTPTVAWLAMAVTGVAALAALWAVLIAMRSQRSEQTDNLTVRQPRPRDPLPGPRPLSTRCWEAEHPAALPRSFDACDQRGVRNERSD